MSWRKSRRSPSGADAACVEVISASLRPDGSIVVGPGESSVVILGATAGRPLVQRSPLASISELPPLDPDEDAHAALDADLEGVLGLPGFGAPGETVLTVLAAPPVRTVADLRTVVDEIRAGETADAGEVPLIDCVPLLARFTGGVYRDGVRPAVPLDDISIGTRSIEQSLVRGPGWHDAPDYGTLVEHVPPGGMLLVLEQYRVGLGHAYALAHTSDAGVVDVDPQRDAASRIRQATPDLRNLVDARFVAVDAQGRAVLDPLGERPAVSTVRTLADPPAVHDYGAQRPEDAGQPEVADENLHAEQLDDRFGPAVAPKKVKDYEQDDKGDVRVNPLWYRLEDFKPQLLERTGGKWLYAIDQHGEVFIGSEEIASLIEPVELDRLLAGMQTKDPGLTREALLEKLTEQGVPTIAVGFEADGTTLVRDGRVGGELLFNPLTERWQIDASSRYMGPQVRPGVEFDTITEWVHAAAERIGAALDTEITVLAADAPRLGDGAYVAGTGTAEHTEEFGPLAGPKKVKDSELDEQQQVRVNPLWYRLEDFKPALLERTSGVWHYAVDEDGQILIGSEEPLTLIEDGELQKLLDGMRSRDPELTMEALKAALIHQGHPSITAGFNEDGTTRVRPARIAGEFTYNKELARWELNDKSGRYMSFKVRPGLKADVARGWLANAAERIGEVLNVPVTPVLFKNAEHAPAPTLAPLRLGDVPPGVGWGHGRWARSWGLGFDPAAGTLYDALLSAGGGSLTAHGELLHDADGARQALGERIGAVEPDAEAFSDAATRLGASVLVLHGDGTVSAHGRGPALVVAETAADGSGAQDAAHWVGLPPADADSGLSGVSAAQIHWAVTEGQRFTGTRGGFFDTLADAGRAAGAVVLDRDPQELRRTVVGWMRARSTARDWSEIFTLARIDAPLHDVATRERIIADVQRDGGDGATDRLLPLLAARSLGVGLRVVDPDGAVHLHAAPDAEPLITLAQVPRPDGAHDAWLGLAPVRPAHSLGAGTRPADVPGGLGWEDRSLAVMLAQSMADPLEQVRSGPVASTVQQDWARAGGRELVEMPEGPDALLEAIVRASGGGFTAKGGYVGDAASMRALLADDIRPALEQDPGLSLVMHTIWSAHSVADSTDAGPEHSAEQDAAFDSGAAVQGLIDAVRDPGGRPRLADDLIPYFANRLGLGIRVVDPFGVVDRFGEGRPVHVAWSDRPDGGGRRWMAAPPAESRYPLGSPLHAPNPSDPALVHLARAIHARKRALQAGGIRASDGDGIVDLLHEAQARWLAHTAPPRRTPGDAARAPEPVTAPRGPRQPGTTGSGFMQSLRTMSRWLGHDGMPRLSDSSVPAREPRRWEATVEGFVQAVHAPFGGTGAASDARDLGTEADLRSGIGLSMAIGLFDALFPQRFALGSDHVPGGEASRELVLEAVQRGGQELAAGGFARRSVGVQDGETMLPVADPRAITDDAVGQRILWSWMGSEHQHEFATRQLLRTALAKAKPWHDAGGERPALLTRAKLSFLTKAEGRAPTLYFVDGNASARIRQQHSRGPIVAEHGLNLHFFFKTERDITAFAAKASSARNQRRTLGEDDLEGINYSLTPTDGDLHYEVSFREDRTVSVTHRSGGRIVTDLGDYDDDRIARIFRAAIGATDPVAADRSQRPRITADSLRPPAQRPAEQWVAAPLAELAAALPPDGAALVLLEDGRSMVLVDTPTGQRLVDFSARELGGDLAGTVSVPTRETIAAVSGGGSAVALVVDGTGHPVTAEQLTEPAIGARFDSALGWGAAPGAVGTDGTGAVHGWAEQHQARFVPVETGPNAVFDAALAAAGGVLHINGTEVADALRLRTALAEHLSERLAAPNSLRDFPSLHAAFAAEGVDRIIDEFFHHDPASADPRAVHRQVGEHIDSGKAAQYLVKALAEPGHWEQITRLAALDTLADATGFGFLAVGPDGRTHLHGEPGSPRLAVGRLGSEGSTEQRWGALVPDEARSRALGEVAPHTATSLGRRAETGPPAELTEQQRAQAASANLGVGLARTGPHALYHAVLDASGGAVHLDRDTLVNDPAELGRQLTGALLARPDLLDEATRQRIGQETTLGARTGDEALLDALDDPADRDAEIIGRHLVGTYLGVKLGVVEPDGTSSVYGTGRPLTVARTDDERSGNLWAALTPAPRAVEQDPAHDAFEPGSSRDHQLPEIGDLAADHTAVADGAEHVEQAPWAPDTFAVQLPGETHQESPWRSATFCAEVEIDGVMRKACVDVAVLTLDAALAAELGVPFPAGR